MLNRFAASGLAALLLAAVSAPALSADWREQHPVVHLSNISSENETDRMERYTPVVAYFEQALGVKVELHNATDYASTIEAMRAKRVEFSRMGPAAYAKADEIMGDDVQPVALMQNADGTGGYHSVVVVRADSPFTSLADLRGKTFAWADPNSASGYQMPNYFLRKEGIDLATFFSRSEFSGSHENSIIALVNGTFDGAATWYRNDEHSNFGRMIQKGMIPEGSVRVIYKSPLIPNSPWVIRTNIPEPMFDAIRQAILAMPEEGKEAFATLTSGNSAGMMEVDRTMYEDVVAAVRDNLRQRRTN